MHAPDHVEGRGGSAPQGHLQHVVANALFQGLAQLVLNLKEAIGRAQPADALVGPAVVVVLDPEANPLAGGLEVLELGAGEELAPDRAPEALNLAEGHRVLGTGANVGDALLLDRKSVV